jgi:uncharacterized protein YggE
MRVTPDLIVWRINLRDEDVELQAAKARNDARLAAALEVIQGLEIPANQLQTSLVSVSREHDNTPQGRGEFRHFSVRRGITVRQTDLEQFDRFFDALLAEADAEVSFNLEHSRMIELRHEAREDAVEQAKLKAERMVQRAGSQVGRLLSLEEHVPGGRGQSPISNIAMHSGALPPDNLMGTLAPGTIEVTASVRAVFEIVE